jgi:hypothetical protein
MVNDSKQAVAERDESGLCSIQPRRELTISGRPVHACRKDTVVTCPLRAMVQVRKLLQICHSKGSRA